MKFTAFRSMLVAFGCALLLTACGILLGLEDPNLAPSESDSAVADAPAPDGLQTAEAGEGSAAIDVTGTVLDLRGVPVQGVDVSAQEHGTFDASVITTVATDSSGRFRITAPARYDLYLQYTVSGVNGVKAVVYLDLTKQDVAIQIPDAISPTRRVNVLSGELAAAANSRVTWSLATANGGITWGAADVKAVDAGKVTYEEVLPPYFGPASTPATLAVLAAKDNAGEGPYRFETRAVQLDLDAGLSLDLRDANNVPPIGTLAVDVRSSGTATLGTLRKQVVLPPVDGGLEAGLRRSSGMDFGSVSAEGGISSIRVPRIDGAKFTLVGTIQGLPSDAFVWAAGLEFAADGGAPDAASLDVPDAAPEFEAPSAEAGPFDLAKPAKVIAPGGGILEFRFACGQNEVTLYSAERTLLLPLKRLRQIGLIFAAGSTCEWSVALVTAFDSTDSATLQPLGLRAGYFAPQAAARSLPTRSGAVIHSRPVSGQLPPR
jgi:hypothetical protein